MKKTVQLIGEVLILIVLVTSFIFAGGYQLNEHGARATGMGGAFVARASDPSAVYFNPAGLAFQKGINLLGGASFIMPSATFKELAPSTTETSTKSQVFTPINLYGTYQLDNEIVFGFGIFNPFGLGTEWPEGWIGKGYSVKSDLQTWYFNPTVAIKVDDQISFGVGVSYIYGKVSMTRIPSSSFPTIKATLDGTGSGYSINVGAIYKPIEDLSIGVSYRTNTDIEFSGDAKFSGVPSAVSSVFPGGTGKATLPMPGNFFIGAAYNIMEDLTIEGDVQYTQWSAYKELKIDIQPVKTLPVAPGVSVQTQGPSTSYKGWNDAIMLRGGAEYKLDAETTLRGGLILDLSPQPPSKTEPMLPDGDRIDITIGGSYKMDENLSVDLAYMLILFMERDAKNSTTLKGTYNSNAHIICINFGYTL